MRLFLVVGVSLDVPILISIGRIHLEVDLHPVKDAVLLHGHVVGLPLHGSVHVLLLEEVVSLELVVDQF